MRGVLTTMFLLAAVTACGKKPDRFEAVLTDLEGFKTKMCGCTDRACVDGVQGEWRAYRKTMRDKVGKDTRPTAAQDQRGKDLDAAMRACREKHDPTAGTGGGAGNGTGGGAGSAGSAAALPGAGSAASGSAVGSAAPPEGPGKQ